MSVAQMQSTIQMIVSRPQRRLMAQPEQRHDGRQRVDDGQRREQRAGRASAGSIPTS